MIHIGNMKLYVNIPRYRRAGFEEGSDLSKVARKQHNHVPIKNKKEEVWKEKKWKEVWKVNKRKQSFADVVRGSSCEKWKGIIVETKQQVLPWMVNNVVCQMSPNINFSQLCEEFIKGGMSMVRVTFLGDNLVLLTPKEGEQMDELLNLNKEWFKSVFEVINQRSELFVAVQFAHFSME